MDVHHLRDPAFDVNLHIVDAPSGWILVDAGTGQAHEALLDRIEEVVAPEAIDLIYLTHWHYDHVGGIAPLQEATGAEVLMHQDEAPAIREGDAERTLGARWGLPQEPCPVRDVQEGDALDLVGLDFQVLLLPGHSPAHTALWHEETRTLLSGDVVFSGGSFGRVDLPGGDPEAMVESLERLTELQAERFYPGHMDPVEKDAHDAIQLSARNARMMLLGETPSGARR